MANNRRQSERISVDVPVAVRWRGLADEPHFSHGKIVDYSSTGVRLEVSEPIDLESLIVAGEPGRNKRACAGKVRYCIPKRTKFIVGVRLDGREDGVATVPDLAQVLNRDDYSLLMFRP